MAETFFTEEMLKKLISLTTEQISLAWGFEEELTQLRQSVEMIQAVLADAARRQVSEEWLQRLKYVAYDADDVLDELAYEILRRKVEIRNQMKRKVCFFFSFSNHNAFRGKMVHRVKTIVKFLKEISEEAIGLSTTVVSVNANPEIIPNREAGAYLDHSKVVGREDNVSEIVDLLLNETNQQLLVIPIVGMAGLGKTTLAKLVYNHELVKKHFDKTIWVCVSNDFDDKKILNEILESLTGNSSALENKNTILEYLKKELQGKQYILVLDDVWNKNPMEWATFRNYLLEINSNMGNSIIVTTRSHEVAEIMETLPRHHLGELSIDECWSMIKKIVSFVPLTLDLEAIGKDIAKKCGGVPLVAKVMGGMMSHTRAKSRWLTILNDEFCSFPHYINSILPILKLSFDDLPLPSIKQCFAYCSILPKGCDINKEELIQLWLAEGFLQPSQGSFSLMEDIGNMYFNIFLANSFFQVAKKDEYGNIIKCKMYDMVHDLAVSIAKFEILIWNEDSWDDINLTLRLLIPSDGKIVPRNLHLEDNHVRKLRTFVLENVVLGNRLLDFRCLRVLKLYGYCVKELPSLVGQLIHLRLLHLSRTDIQALPKSITKLYNLQTLRFESCHHLKELPEDLSDLSNLRHICIDHDYIKRTPKDMGKLTCLQTLPFFDVGQDVGRQIKELGHLNQLRGELDIYNLQHVRDKREAKSANLAGKEKIHKLRFFWSRDRECNHHNDEEVLDGLQPHRYLKSLTIEGFEGETFPSWSLTSRDARDGLLPFDNLIDISLRYCSKCEEVPTLGHLTHLRVLQIVGMYNVRCIGTKFYKNDYESAINVFFPALRRLELKLMYNLVEWKDAQELTTASVVFPCLEELTIEGCHELISVPCHFSSLKKLRISKIRSTTFEKISSKLTTLTFLYIKDVSELAYFPKQLFQTNTGLMSLQIQGCLELLSISPHQDALQTILSLNELVVENCPNLRSVPRIQGATSLLRIIECPNLPSIPNLRELHSLVQLEIENFPNLISIPDLGELHSLVRLEIENCHNLMYVPDLRELHSLSSLEIFNCRKLTCLPEGLDCLTGLKTLAIGGFCEELDAFPSLSSIQHLHASLEHLYLYGWAKLNSLPDGIQRFTALATLWILEFHGIEALPEWLGNLSSLQELYLNTCKSLLHLPTLTVMRRLTIINCSKLKERYAKGRGAEWSKISNIPDVCIY